jgi:GTP-binding protein HflX
MAAVLIPPKRGEASDLIRVEYAYPKPEAETNECFYSEPVLLHELDVDFLALMSALEEEFSRNSKASKSASGRERAFLVGTSVKSMADAKLSVEELENLCDTAGMLVVGSVIQARDKFDPKFLIGSGKFKEILLEAARLQAELLVFDRELSPSQLAAISDETDLSVLDRTMVILDIFAQHARTRDGKLQVELAQLKYRIAAAGQQS